MADGDKIKGLFQRANRAAVELDPQMREQILGQVALKATDDPRFREALRKNPTQIVEQEAARLNIQASPEELKAVGEKAQEIASRAVPDASGAEVKEMVFRTVKNIETSFRLTLTLAKWLFFSGLGMMVSSFIIIAVYRDKQTAAIFGVGGLLSLVLGTVINTLDRVRDAAANLVQIQMAYLAYYKILDMLGPVAGTTSREDAISYAKELTANVDTIMRSLQGILKASKEPTLSKQQNKEKEVKPKVEGTPAKGKKVEKLSPKEEVAARAAGPTAPPRTQ